MRPLGRDGSAPAAGFVFGEGAREHWAFFQGLSQALESSLSAGC